MLKKLFVSTLLFVFAVNSLSVFAQVSKRPAPKTTAPVSKFNQDETEIIKPDDSANDFAANGLPVPEDFGGEPNDALAAALAKEITNYDKDNLPLLITTLQRAGFFVINDNQKVLYQPTSGQGMGLAFYDYEVAGMYKLSRRGIVSSVEKLASQLGKDTPDMLPSTIADLMLQDLRASANSSNKHSRFWARLIIEIGKSSPQPIDLLTANAANARLNIIQLSLWERRMIGDFVALAMSFSASFHSVPKVNRVKFINSSFTAFSRCHTSDVESLILDTSSIVATAGGGKLIDEIKKGATGAAKEKLEKITGKLGIINIALAWAKLVAAVMTLKGEIKIAEPMPLERTKNANTNDPKNFRLMTAKVWADVGNFEYLNCVRLAINLSSGLDFSMPNDGPLSDRDISWELIGGASFAGQKSSKTGKLDNFVNLEVPEAEQKKGAKPDVTKQITDENGTSRINIVGAPKIPAVINLPVVPVRKKATVKISVAMKSKRDGWQNLIDVGGTALGIGTGAASDGVKGILMGVLSSLPEIGFRMKWDIEKLRVPVKDWELCTSDWAGTVKYTRIYKRSDPVNTGSRRGTRTIDEKTEIEWTLNPRKRDMPADTPPIPDDVSVKVDNSDIFEGTGEADVCCDKKEAKEAGARIREAITLKVDNETTSILKINLSDGNFLLSIYPFIADYNAFKGTKRRSFTVSESECPVDEDHTAESTIEAFAERSLEALQKTKTNRKLSNHGESVEELSGSEKFDDPRGGEITYVWSLARCGGL